MTAVCCDQEKVWTHDIHLIDAREVKAGARNVQVSFDALEGVLARNSG